MADEYKKSIREYFVAIADLVQIPATEFIQAADALKKVWNIKKANEIKEKEQFIRDKGLHRKLLREYYNAPQPYSDFKQFSILVSNQEFTTNIFTTPDRINLNLSLSEIETSFVAQDNPPLYSKEQMKEIKKQATKVANNFELLDVTFWDQDIFRLIGNPFTGAKPKFTFSVTRFLQYQFSSGLLANELFEALIDNNNDAFAILKDKQKYLPLRNKMLPTRKSFSYFQERLSTGGVACVFALARDAEDDYVIPIQLRSGTVSEGGNVYTGSVQAWHQPNVADYKDEAKLYWTVMREIFEEIFDGEEKPEGHIHKTAPYLRHDWYLGTDKGEGVIYLYDKPNEISIELLGVGINSLIGTYDCAILVTIHNPEYWNKFLRKMKHNWEAQKWHLLSTREKLMEDLNMIFASGWYDQGMFGLSQGLLRLKEIAPEKFGDMELEIALD